MTSERRARKEKSEPTPEQKARWKAVCEAVIFAADKPVTMAQLRQVFEPDADVGPEEIEAALEALRMECAAQERALTLVEVSAGWAFRTKPEYREWISRLTAPKAQRLSRAQL